MGVSEFGFWLRDLCSGYERKDNERKEKKKKTSKANQHGRTSAGRYLSTASTIATLKSRLRRRSAVFLALSCRVFAVVSFSITQEDKK